MRLFIAVPADEETRAEAAAVVARLRALPGDYRWVDPRDMHVTLRFFGETPDDKLPEIEALMRAAAAQAKSFELSFGGVGAFDSLDAPRVVWLGVDEGKAPLESLAQAVLRDEPRPYSPHLTIGRNRREEFVPEFVAGLKAEPVLGMRRPVTKISLYASKPAPFGHTYEILSEADLRL